MWNWWRVALTKESMDIALHRWNLRENWPTHFPLDSRLLAMRRWGMENGRGGQTHACNGESHVEAKGLMPCSYCGVFRRQGLNALAERVGADVMALGHNLDDMAQSILMNLQKGEIERSVRLAPHTHSKIDGLIPRIVPFDGYLSKRSMLMPCLRTPHSPWRLSSCPRCYASAE